MKLSFFGAKTPLQSAVPKPARSTFETLAVTAAAEKRPKQSAEGATGGRTHREVSPCDFFGPILDE